MPIVEILDVADTSDELAEATGRVFASLVKYLAETREVRARGRRGGERAKSGGAPRILTPSLKWQVDVSEDPTELARSFAKRIVEIITIDAGGEAWTGVVELVGDPDDKGKPVLLDAPKIAISAGAPQPKATREDEFVGMMGVMTNAAKSLGDTIKLLGDVVVKVGSTKADELSAYASMATALSAAFTSMTKSDGKWGYKIAKEKEETARTVEEERSRAQRSANFWSAIEVWSEEWKDVAVIWSQYFAGDAGRRQGMPNRPTLEEIDAVFTWDGASVDGVPFGEVFDPIRAIVSEMIAEPDVKRRLAMAKMQLKTAINALSESAQATMKIRMLQVLGEDRTKEVAAWLTLPVS